MDRSSCFVDEDHYADSLIRSTEGVTFPHVDPSELYTPDGCPSKVRPMEESEPYTLDRYGKVMSELMRCPLISMQARGLYSILATYVGSRSDGRCWPTLEMLMDNTGWTKPTVIGYLDELELVQAMVREGNQKDRVFRLTGKVDLTNLANRPKPTKKKVIGKTGLTDDAIGKTSFTDNGKAHFTDANIEGTVRTGSKGEREKRTREAGSRTTEIRHLVTAPNELDGWSPEMLPARQTYLDCIGKSPPAVFRKTVAALLMPKESGQGARRSGSDKQYDGYTIDQVCRAIEDMATSSHNSADSLIGWISGEITPRKQGNETNKQPDNSRATKPQTDHERRREYSSQPLDPDEYRDYAESLRANRGGT